MIREKWTYMRFRMMVMKASEHTSETFAALSDDIVKDSKATFEKLSKRMDLNL